jgi:hypothetical protein
MMAMEKRVTVAMGHMMGPPLRKSSTRALARGRVGGVI